MVWSYNQETTYDPTRLPEFKFERFEYLAMSRRSDAESAEDRLVGIPLTPSSNAPGQACDTYRRSGLR